MKVAVLGSTPAARDITAELDRMGASVRLFETWTKVTKRFLLTGQTPPNKSRFFDLFRVTYAVDPRPAMEESRQNNPEAFERLTAEFMASLDGRMEMFEDVDVVIDASAGAPRTTMGPGGPAVGEDRLRPGTLLVAPFNDLTERLADSREIALVGSGESAAEALVQLQPWLNASPTHRIFLVSAHAQPFATVNDPALNTLLKAEHALQLQQTQTYQVALGEWNELDDFIRAKKSQPEYPIPRLVVFSGHMVSVVDQLVDQTRTFLTCETIPWTKGEMQPENNDLELKTIGVDRIVVATGVQRSWENFPGLDLITSPNKMDARDERGFHPEIGFFTLGDKPTLERRQSILQELNRLFSPRGDHP